VCASTESTGAKFYLHASPWLDTGKGRSPHYRMNCENKKPPTTLACAQGHRWVNTTGTRVATHRCPSRAPEAKPQGAWAAVSGEAISPTGSDLAAHPALSPRRDTAKRPSEPRGGWDWVRGSLEVPAQTSALRPTHAT